MSETRRSVTPYVLVVGADSATHSVVRTLLEEAGYEVELSPGGWAALGRIGLRVPDLVITELHMEGMEGMEFLRRVRTIWPDEPVLVMSSRAVEGPVPVLELLKHLGAAGFLQKPLVVERLMEEVEKALSA